MGIHSQVAIKDELNARRWVAAEIEAAIARRAL